MTDMEKRYEDEIEISDILKVVWKWKYLIVTGTLIFAVVGGIIGYAEWKGQPQIYNASVILKPILREIDERGNKRYIYTLENMESLIDGDLKHRVASADASSNAGNKNASINIGTEINGSSQVLEISCQSEDPDTAINALHSIIDLLIEAIQHEFALVNKSDIQVKQLALKHLKSASEKLRRKIAIIENRLKDLNQKLEAIHTNNTVPHQTDLENQYKQDIYLCLLEKADIQLELSKNRNEMETVELELAQLGGNTLDSDPSIKSITGKASEGVIAPVRVVRPPKAQTVQVTNKTKKNIILSGLFGLFIMLFISFVIEYLKRVNQRQNISQNG